MQLGLICALATAAALAPPAPRVASTPKRLKTRRILADDVVLYAKGEGVEQDMIEAASYWLIASQMGNEAAGIYLGQLSASLGSAERERLSARATELLGELGFVLRAAEPSSD